MAGWLNKYEQGGLILKKKTKDNYGKRENANEGYSTAGPGWVGEGTTNRGFNYNGAWGGTMEMGGSMPGAVGFTYAREAGSAPANGKYTKKTKASAQNGVRTKPTVKQIMQMPNKNLQDKVEGWLGNPMRLAEETADLHTEPGNDQTDNLRHPLAGRYTSEAIQNKLYNIPVISQLAGFLGASAAGLGHELIEPNRGPKKNPYSTWDTIREGAEDQFNNMVGAAVGSMPFLSKDNKTKTLQYLSDNNLLPDGYGRNKDDMYFKKQNGGEMKYYQEGLDFKPKTISKNGSVIKDDRGQWAYPGEITEIGSNDITMQGVDYPILGISDTGDTQMMYPDQDYKFDGKKVTEYPMAQDGRNLSNELKKEAEERLSRIGKPKSTISQYTPKEGEQTKFDKQKLQRIAEESKPLNKFARSKASGNLQDAAMFAADVMTLGEAAALTKPVLKAAAKYATEKTALKNAYKLNPYAFKPTEGMMYRGLGKEGMEDALASGVFRANPSVEPVKLGRFDVTRQFSKAYFSPKFNVADQYGKGYIAEVPRTASDWGKRYARTDWSQIAQRDIPITEGKILEKDWLKRYKEVPKKEKGGWLNKYK